MLGGDPLRLGVREVGPDDWELFRQVRLAALAEAPSAFGSRHADWLDAEPKRWQARLRDVPLNLVLIMEGQPVAMVSGTEPVDDTVELISLWVAPPARGHGVAEEAVHRVQGWARAQGARRLVLSVKIANAPARRLYERLGFELGPAPDDPDELVMSLALGPRGRLPAPVAGRRQVGGWAGGGCGSRLPTRSCVWRLVGPLGSRLPTGLCVWRLGWAGAGLVCPPDCAREICGLPVVSADHHSACAQVGCRAKVLSTDLKLHGCKAVLAA